MLKNESTGRYIKKNNVLKKNGSLRNKFVNIYYLKQNGNIKKIPKKIQISNTLQALLDNFNELHNENVLGNAYNPKLIEKGVSQIPRFGATKYNFKYGLPRPFADMSFNAINNMFQNVIDTLKQNSKNSKDQVNVIISSQHLSHHISTGFYNIDEISTEIIYSKIEASLQSNEDFNKDKDINIEVIEIKYPVGGTTTPVNFHNIQENRSKKRSIIPINNTDTLCFDRCLSIFQAKHVGDDKYEQIRKGRNIQTERATALRYQVNIPQGEMIGLSDIEKYEALLGFQINIICAESNNAYIYPPQEDYDTSRTIITLHPFVRGFNDTFIRTAHITFLGTLVFVFMLIGFSTTITVIRATKKGTYIHD